MLIFFLNAVDINIKNMYSKLKSKKKYIQVIGKIPLNIIHWHISTF